MGRWFVGFWLLVVIFTLVGMQAWLFGTKGLPKFGAPREAREQPAPVETPSPPSVEKPTAEPTPPARVEGAPVEVVPAPVAPVKVEPAVNERYREIKVGAGTLEWLEVAGGGVPGVTRDILVWLPPGYDAPENRTRTYPALYLMDGQNVFDTRPGAAGEWRADETAAELIGSGKIEPLIIVGVPSVRDGAKRSREYLPFELLDNVEPHGAEFVAFLVGEVRARVEGAFRVRAGLESTGVGGAGLGAIIALEAATEHPEVFGLALCESVPLVAKQRAAFRYFAAKRTWPAKLALGMGGKEAGSEPEKASINRQYTAMASAFKELAQGKGLGPDRFRLTIDAEAGPNEAAWAKRFGPALEFLFPAGK
jgi:predicted alpha/beta superfamily hydrolase